MTTGDRIPSSGSPVVTKPHCQGLFPGFLSPAVRQLAPFLGSEEPFHVSLYLQHLTIPFP